MTAAVLLSHKAAEQGLRRTDPKRDLAAVGELMELAFGPELDASGRRMVREMKRYGQYGWLGWLLAQLMIPTAAFPRGFVWMEDGRLVGNAHMLRIPGYSHRWVIANVAVHPDFQRRRIATLLVEACIRTIRSYGARQIILQVREKNAGARRLYEQLHFTLSATRTDWICPQNSGVVERVDNPFIRPRRQGEWHQQVDLVKQQYPEGLIWPIPSIEPFFKPASLAGALGLDFRNHWVWVESGRMLGSLSLVSRQDLSGWHVILAAGPAFRGKLEATLLPFVLPELKRVQKPVMFSYPVGLADEQIAGLGFVPKNTLHWMFLNL
ncbi:MAG: GNAT family N-acetyltransferase [Anaerolineales bacterium]|nr:GNAT family N-acetyltransferase [Anaerolineales bacterium]